MAKKQYDRRVDHLANDEDLVISDALFESMWQLFEQIGKHWKTGNQEELKDAQTNLLVFMNNRIRLNPCYIHEYQNAAGVVAELVEDLGKKKGYEKLFTDPYANQPNPVTRLARARKMVSNEFVLLHLALGGFKSFGAENYLGYFGGANIAGNTPYRTYAN